jgi:hypothetical protein
MKATGILALAAALSFGFCLVGCETSHKESDTPNMFGGGSTHEETTTTHNPITDTNDTTSTEKQTR